MSRSFAARPLGGVLAATLALAGCTGGGPDEPEASSTVEAFPDPPSVAGPLEVELRPALQLLSGDRRCRPDLGAGQLCSPDGSGGYRVLGATRPVTVRSVTTTASEDRTSWGTTIRFAVASRAGVRAASEQAAGLGGVVLVTSGASVLQVLEPLDLTPRRAALLGLEKSEAWAVVDTFEKAQTRSKQGM
jgi:hypothetical protein